MTAPSDELKDWRDRAKLTQEQAARRLDITLRNYQRWESGETTPWLKAAVKIEQETGIPVSRWVE